MEKLVFDNLEEAKKYSKKYFDGSNLICKLDGKIIYGSSSRRTLLNPKLYIKELDEVKEVIKSLNDDKPKVIKSFLDL